MATATKPAQKSKATTPKQEELNIEAFMSDGRIPLDRKIEVMSDMADEMVKEVEKIRATDEKVVDAAGDALGSIGQVFSKFGGMPVSENAAETIHETVEPKAELEVTLRGRIVRYIRKGGHYAMVAVKEPIPTDRKQLVVAGTWYGLGAVTPLGIPAQRAVRFITG